MVPRSPQTPPDIRAPSPRGLLASFLKNALLTGFLVIAPLGITVWVFTLLLRFADGAILLLPEWARPEAWLGVPIPGLGILLTLLLMAGVGTAMRYYTGRRVVEAYERLLARVPVASGVYQGVKQLIQTLFNARNKHFRQVVLIEYPRRGIYSLAFITNHRTFVDCLPECHDPDLVSVFLPTTPNPTSGFYLMVPRRDVRVVDVSVEEAFKLIMSAGIVLPEGIRVAGPLAAGDAGAPAPAPVPAVPER